MVSYATRELKSKALMPVPISLCISAIQGLSDEAILAVMDDLISCIDDAARERWFQAQVSN